MFLMLIQFVNARRYYHQKPDEVTATTQKAVAIPTIKSAASLAKTKAEASAAAPAPAPAPVHTSTVSVTVDGVPNRIMCRHFARGFCSLGETCRFAHVQGGGQQAAPSFNIEAVKKTRPCLYFASGVCSRGDQCLFIHETPATQPAATSAPASTPKITKKTTPIVQSTSQVTQNEESDSESEDDNDGDDDLRVCIECEKPGIARWVCGKCDKALYCDDCNAAVHRSKVMSKHKRALLPPPAVKKEKCGECEEADADVKCEQCEVVYCSACDASVHKFKSLRKHTRVPIDVNASKQPAKEKKQQQKKKVKNEPSNSNSTPAMETATAPVVTAAAAAASKFAPEPVAIPQSAKDAAKTFVESVPQMDFSSDSDSDSASDDDSDADDNSDDDASSDVQPSSTHQPTPIPVHRPAPVTEISSESSDDDEEMAPAQAKPAAAKKTTPVQTSSRAAVPAGDESDASSESDFDDVRPTNLQSASVTRQAKTPAMQAKAPAVQADSSSSSSSESESDDDEEVKPSPPPVAARPPAKSHAPRVNANRKAGISDGSSHTLVKKIEAYYESGNAEALHLDANLNAFERLLAHDCAERLGLQHVSVGEGLERHITISHGAIGAAVSSNKRPSELKPGKEAKRRKNHQ